MKRFSTLSLQHHCTSSSHPCPEFVSLKSSCLRQELFNILTLDSCGSVGLPFLVFDWNSGHPGDFSQCCWLHVHCGDGWRRALCAHVLFTWTGVHSTSLSAVGCRYTVVKAEDSSRLLGPTVSTSDHFLQCYRFWLMIDDRLYSTILCSLEQTHCARMWFYMCDKHFIAQFFNIHWSGILKGWHGWCHIKLLLPRCKFCVHHTTMLHVTSCKAAYIRCMHV